MMFPIFFNFKIKHTIIALSLNFIFLLASIIIGIIRFDQIKKGYIKEVVILELIACAITLAITQLISMLDHQIRQQVHIYIYIYILLIRWPVLCDNPLD